MHEANPRVAVPARLSVDEVDPRVAVANRIFHDVLAIVRAHGLEPVVVREAGLDADIGGVVLPGGGDIDPERYGGARTDAVYDTNPAQDDLDLSVARAAIDAELPVLGICRGAQILNVVSGGTLITDIEPGIVEHHREPGPGEEPGFAWHPVWLEPSRLRDELGVEVVSVATGHHQGIATLGRGLRVTARAADGMVEALEDESGRLVGVQWHPEAAGTPRAEQDAPFRAFARAVTGWVPATA